MTAKLHDEYRKLANFEKLNPGKKLEVLALLKVRNAKVD